MKRSATWLLSSFFVLLLASSTAFSQHMASGWYVEAGGGVTFLSETGITQLPFSFSAESDAGFNISGAIGKQTQIFRTEGEIFYSSSDFDTISSFGMAVPLNGDVSVFGGLGNIYVDFDTGSRLWPYLGAGVGYANVSLNDLSAITIPLVDDDDSAFAYQLKAGLSYSINPTTDFAIGYRFFGTEDLDFTDAAGFAFETDGIESHSLEVRVRFRF